MGWTTSGLFWVLASTTSRHTLDTQTITNLCWFIFYFEPCLHLDPSLLLEVIGGRRQNKFPAIQTVILFQWCPESRKIAKRLQLLLMTRKKQQNICSLRPYTTKVNIQNFQLTPRKLSKTFRKRLFCCLCWAGECKGIWQPFGFQLQPKKLSY